MCISLLFSRITVPCPIMAPFNPHQLNFSKGNPTVVCTFSALPLRITSYQRKETLLAMDASWSPGCFFRLFFQYPTYHASALLTISLPAAPLYHFILRLPHFTAHSPLAKSLILIAHSHPPPGNLYTSSLSQVLSAPPLSLWGCCKYSLSVCLPEKIAVSLRTMFSSFPFFSVPP